ncbi:MAG: ribosome biogenesis GTPase Der [Armatimonadetes bacterium]|nr:ribosome biogenesis GTPase Der [Armatimonadota bacterium]
MSRSRLPRLVIVGRPNVGKSTLFNRIIRRRVAVVESSPGVTRDRLYHEAEWEGRRFEMVDTGGILFTDEDPLLEQIRTQAQVALAEADVVLFMTDATDGIMAADRDLADSLRGIGKPVLVAVNKADNPERDSWAAEFYALGIGEVLPISALHGRGVAELLDRVLELTPESAEPPEEEQRAARIAIVGRPNVGKSSLVNAFVGSERVIVSETPGTTRDAIDTEIDFRGEKVILVDTAGLRRRGKVQGSMEYYTALRAQRAIERAGVALIVVAGSEGQTHGDKRIGKAAHDAGKACVFAINKWDLVEPPDGRPKKRSEAKIDFTKDVRDHFPELSYAPLCFTSATCGTGIDAALQTCLEALENSHFRVPTGALNRIVRDATYDHPFSRKGRPLRIYYATQSATAPPRFLMFCNDPELVHFSYKRYLENRIREEFPLEGTPIRLEFRSSPGKGHARRGA